jgi:FkbM family methyltransferase
MTLTSYAQNFEDVILWRALKHVDRGFYIDIGAQDPIVDSVSLAFYEKGWRGVHVEPIKKYAKKIRAARPDEEVIESAIAEEAGVIDFLEIANTGLSTGDPAIATEHKRKQHKYRATKVPCLPLSELLDRYHDYEIHWLKIDVEGMEVPVVRSWEPSKVRPWIVVVESTKPNSPELTFADWEPQLVALGYEFVYFDGINRFYVNREHPELKKHFGSGPNVFDGFVLSGQASAPFCARVNAEAASLREQAATYADQAARLSKRIEGLGARAAELETQIEWLHQSTSWRVTAPLRFIKRSAKWFVVGTWSWLTLKPGSRPRRTARRTVIIIANVLVQHRQISDFITRLLGSFPSLDNRLRAIVQAERSMRHRTFIPQQPVRHITTVSGSVTQKAPSESPSSQEDEMTTEQDIFAALVTAAEKWKKAPRIRV